MSKFLVLLALFSIASGPLASSSGLAATAADPDTRGLRWTVDKIDPARRPAEPVASYEYPTDPEALKVEFRATGTVTVQLAPALHVVVVGTEEHFIVDRNIYSMSLDKGMVKIGEYRSIAVRGEVPSIPGSSALVLLGNWGIYGEIEVPGGRYTFHARTEGDSFIQIVRFYTVKTKGDFEAPVQRPATPRVQAPDGPNATVSFIWIQTDHVLADSNPTWMDLATTAFTAQKSAWTAAEDIRIDMQIERIGLIEDDPDSAGLTTISAEGACANTGNNYIRYLEWYFGKYYGPWRHHAHQFWSGSAFDSERGCAVEDTVGYANPRAVGVVSGVSTDGYDVNDPKDRGITSGTELGHVYGSGHHYDQHPVTNLYELMANLYTPQERDYFFGKESQSHIYCRFYHSKEPPCGQPASSASETRLVATRSLL